LISSFFFFWLCKKETRKRNLAFLFEKKKKFFKLFKFFFVKVKDLLKENKFKTMNLFIQSLAHFFFRLECKLSIYVGSFYIILLSLFFSLATLGVKLLPHIPIYQNIYVTSFVSLLLCAFNRPFV